MRVTVLGMRSKLLRADFEPPPGVTGRHKNAMHVNRHPKSTAIAMKFLVGGGRPSFTGVWDTASGKLVWSAAERVGDIAWSPDGKQAFVVMPRFGTGPKGRGIGHCLLRYSWPGLKSRQAPELLEQMDFSVPSGGPDRLVVSGAGNLGLVAAIEQGDWYYEVLKLQPILSQPLIGHQLRSWLVDSPEFSPDERYVVAVGGSSANWWAPDAVDWEEESEPVSPGGTVSPGFVCVHDMKSKRVTERPIQVKLPAGWQPRTRKDDVGGYGWGVIWGPQFLDERSFRIWLPDRSPLDLPLPLPKVIRIAGLDQRGR